MSEMLFKCLGKNGAAYHGGHGSWPLPTEEGPGAWLSVEGPLVPCENGLHLARVSGLMRWLSPEIYEAEHQGERIDTNDKVVVREARLVRRLNWNDRTARLFACDCAERALPIYERLVPNDPSVRACIETARRFANDEATSKELSAARDAAWSATWDAAWSAAWSAARSATRDAARDATRDAAWYAAWSAARDSEREWQTQRLLHYLGVEK